MTEFRQDLRYALRTAWNSPGFSCIAILTLALGIGANTTLFSVVNSVLLNPLPYPNSDQLVRIYGSTPGFERGPIVYLNFLDWQRDNRTFSSMAVYRNQDYSVTGTAEAERLTGYMISADFFAVLGVQPVVGRTFRAQDDQIGAAPVVILGGGYWQRRYGSSPEAIGRQITLNGTSYTIVGVVPPTFSFYGQDRDVYVPIGRWTDPSFRDRRISVSAQAIGRLKAGATVEQAQADMNAVMRNLAAEFPVADKDVGVTLVSMKEDIVGNARPFLIVLLSAVGFLLMIACANVANLLLARSMRRSREFAIRAALGAGHARIVRQLLTESVVLGGMGGACGLLAGWAGTRMVRVFLSTSLPRAQEIALDGRVLLFTLAVSLAAAIAFGLAPALRGSRSGAIETLKEAGRGSSRRHRMQSAFVAIEVAMSVVLLIGAGLMLRSLSALWRVHPGYNPSHAITFNLALPATAATTPAETRARLRRFDDAMRTIPAVRAVSVTLGSRPMIHDSFLPFWIEGRPKPANDAEMPQAMFFLVESGFEQAMGVELKRGRFVTDADREGAPIVIDIDDAFAHAYFPGEDPIGKRVNITQFNVQAEIVGVVGHIRQWGLAPDQKGAIQAQFLYPFMQMPEKLMPLSANGVAVVLRTEGDAAAVMEPVRRAVVAMDSRQIVYGVRTLDGVLAESVAPQRLSMLLLAIFAALALLLSCVGIYGVISYVVGQRTREIGVRMALGAQHADVMRLVLGEGTRMALAGVATGVAAASGLTRLMASQLYGVSAQDPATFAVSAAILAIVAVAACYVPARRAVAVDPTVALRDE